MFQGGLFFKLFVFFKVDLSIIVTIIECNWYENFRKLYRFFVVEDVEMKIRNASFLFFILLFGAVSMSSSNGKMLCMLIRNYQTWISCDIFILIFMDDSPSFWRQKMGVVNEKEQKTEKVKSAQTKWDRKTSSSSVILLHFPKNLLLLLLYCAI